MDKPKLTPKDFFLYFGAMLTLYWSAGSLLALLFRIVDTVFRDDLEFYFDPYSSGIRFAIASLIVVLPISLWLFRTVKRDALLHPEKFLLPLRRWLYAITIFVTAAALVGDVIALLNSFLGGELTTRFVLKVLSVLVVAGIVFWYCLLEIRVRPEAPAPVRRSFLIGVPVLVLAAIVYGFFVMGSPATQRNLRFDERRVGDLQSIQWQVVNYWQQKGYLPEGLLQLEDSISGFRPPTDPVSKEPYAYIRGKETSFTLCATFALPTPAHSQIAAKPRPIAGGVSDNWEHTAGRTCFERTIDKDLYPRIKLPQPI